jgi:hypothetical protein
MKNFLLTLSVLFSTNLLAVDFYKYNYSEATKLPTHQVIQYKPHLLKGKTVRLHAKLLKTSGNFVSGLMGLSSVVVQFHNLNRQGYKYDVGRIYLSGDTVSSLKGRENKSFVVEGTITSAELSKDRQDGERILAISMDESGVWK